MASKLFERGYGASREEKKRQEKVREEMGKKLWRFFISPKSDEQEADVRFLTEVPVNFEEHNIKSKSGSYVQHTCTRATGSCTLCDDYDDRPSYKGAYLVVDHREYEYTDEKGKKKKGRDQVRLFVGGMKVVSQLDRLSNKYGITNRDLNIVRLGTGTDTAYTFERGDEEPYTKKEIANLLPEALREMYDGSQDSLLAIVEEQLMMNVKDYKPEGEEADDEDEEDDEDDYKARKKKFINLDEDDEDEEEEYEKPKSKFKYASNKSSSLTKNKSTGSSSKFSKESSSTKKTGLLRKPQNSMRCITAKSLLQK